MQKHLSFAAVVAALAVALVGCAAPRAEAELPGAAAPGSPGSTLQSDEAPSEPRSAEIDLPEGPAAGTEAAIAWEALMGADGEYAASASYLAVLAAFGDVEPYASIQEAEERHSDALIRQLERMGVDAPENPHLGSIPAPADLEEAALSWAEGEVANIAMYDDLIAQSLDPALIRVLTNLRTASAESHLPAFEAAATTGGTSVAAADGIASPRVPE